MRYKKSQSQVISAVILIMLVLVTISIIMAFVIPFVKNQLEGSDCIDIVNQIEIRNHPQYTCYNKNANETYIQVHVGDVLDKIKGFSLEVGGASTKSYMITPDNPDNIEMYGGGTFELPGKNEERTYNITNMYPKPELIRVYPILKNNEVCGQSDTMPSVSNCFTI